MCRHRVWSRRSGADAYQNHRINSRRALAVNEGNWVNTSQLSPFILRTQLQGCIVVTGSDRKETLLSASFPAAPQDAAISAQNVHRHYVMGPTVIPAVDGVTLTVRRGDFTALLGSSGSGKSTLMNLIAGLDRPTSGSIFVEGEDLASKTSQQLAL